MEGQSGKHCLTAGYSPVEVTNRPSWRAKRSNGRPMSASTARQMSDKLHTSGDWAQPHQPVRSPDETGFPLVQASRRLSLPQALAVARERLLWNRRASRWDEAGSTGLTEVVAEVLRECRVTATAQTVAVDLGAGSGQVTIPLAKSCGRVLAVDVSPRLLERLATNAVAHDVANIELLTQAVETLSLAPASVDLVVSNYALHHLRDIDKDRLLKRCHEWLRPGGRIVIGDMMLGRGADPTDRAIIAAKVRVLLRRGPGGWWRLLKNAVRFSIRLGERPLPPRKWEALTRGAGFEEVSVSRLRSEAGLLTGIKS